MCLYYIFAISVSVTLSHCPEKSVERKKRQASYSPGAATGACLDFCDLIDSFKIIQLKNFHKPKIIRLAQCFPE